MLTLICYILLKYLFDEDWNGLILFLPIYLDCLIFDAIEDYWRERKCKHDQN